VGGDLASFPSYLLEQLQNKRDVPPADWGRIERLVRESFPVETMVEDLVRKFDSLGTGRCSRGVGRS